VKYLFVHQNFPGQFVHIVRHLVASGRHDVVFICEPNSNSIPGVRRVSYQGPERPGLPTHADARDFAAAMARAEAVSRAAQQVRQLGFTPDIIIGHHGWGELLNLQDVWPGVPLLGYHEFYYALDGLDVGFDPEFPVGVDSFANIRAKNAVNLLALTNPGVGQTPTQFQLDTYPAWARPSIHLLREGVDLDICRPSHTRPRLAKIGGVEIAADDRLVTYVARDLEPYRGFHIMMRAIPGILRARPDVRVVMVGADGVSYGARLSQGTWREHLMRELRGQFDPARIHFPGKLDHSSYVRLLQRSDAHVYLTYPFVASWSLREAMACGCALVCSDTAPVREFVTHGETGMLTPFLDPGALADRVVETLEGGPEVTAMRRRAHEWAQAHLSMQDYLHRYEALIARLTGQPPPAAPRPPPRPLAATPRRRPHSAAPSPTPFPRA
jgi:glycosyltransferase involved in cell wall biosynthesis